MTAALFHFLWQGAAIAATLAIALCFVRRATTRYALACIALLALPTVFAITLALQTPAPAPPIRFVTPLLPRPELLPVSSSSSPRLPLDPVFWWTLGVALVYAYRVVGWLSAQWLRRTAVCTVSADRQQRLTELARRIGLNRHVVLLESMLAKTPVTIGTFRPVILLPLGLLTGMPVEHVEAILLHELAHIRRHDYLVNLAQSAIEGLLFYHPATWWISHVIRREREHCCDDIAAAATSTSTYAQALTALAEHRVQTPLLAASGGLMSRVHRLLYPNQRAASPIPAAIFLTLATAAALLAFKPEPQPQTTPDPQPAVTPAPPARPSAPPRKAASKSVVAQVPSQPAPATNSEEVAAALSRMREAARELSALAHRRWLNEEVVWIITPEERSAYGRLETEQEHQRFIEQFWLRRDPTPDTFANEYRDEHYRRIARANEQFPFNGPGWKTDRGSIYIKFGAPDEREEHPATPNTAAYEKWRYKFLEGIGNNVIIEFVDIGEGDFRMTMDPNAKVATVEKPKSQRPLFEQLQEFQPRKSPTR